MFTFAWPCDFELFSGLLFVGWIDGSAISHFSSEFSIWFGKSSTSRAVERLHLIWFQQATPHVMVASQSATCAWALLFSWIFSSLSAVESYHFSTEKGKSKKWAERHLAVKFKKKKNGAGSLWLRSQTNQYRGNFFSPKNNRRWYEIQTATLPLLKHEIDVKFSSDEVTVRSIRRGGGSVPVHKTGQLLDEFNKIELKQHVVRHDFRLDEPAAQDKTWRNERAISHRVKQAKSARKEGHKLVAASL